ncbi:hypothetical protein HOLleu_34036 [Holothuria leucospilota]|uniref:Uncharacterized protein n=1 Tax=Holothuria leucospilota TaxID=206669 RepID=A0A9Q0YPP2_HOLLE|nr:hypothetical protein HOLleu_34036 [Holothuria leucospilota]
MLYSSANHFVNALEFPVASPPGLPPDLYPWIPRRRGCRGVFSYPKLKERSAPLTKDL